MASSFTMPIIHTAYSVTWTPTPEDEAWAKCNHGGQSFEKLASRGGLDWAELRAVLANEEYMAMSESRAARACHLIFQHRNE